jgi:hypothetical protein
LAKVLSITAIAPGLRGCGEHDVGAGGKQVEDRRRRGRPVVARCWR